MFWPFEERTRSWLFVAAILLTSLKNYWEEHRADVEVEESHTGASCDRVEPKETVAWLNPARHDSTEPSSSLQPGRRAVSCTCLVKEFPHRGSAVVPGTLSRRADRVSCKQLPERAIVDQSPN